MAKDKRDKKKRPKLPEPPSVGVAGLSPSSSGSKLSEPPSVGVAGPPSPSGSESKLPESPPTGAESTESDDPTSETALSPEKIASHSSLLSEIKDMGFTEGLEKLDPSEIKKPPKRVATQEIDYKSTLQRIDPKDLEKPGPTLRTTYLKFSEEYERAAEELESKGMLTNAAVAYACAAMCVYIAGDARAAVNFLSSYAKGATEIAKDATFQAAKQVLKGAIVKDKLLLMEAAALLRRSALFSREDKDVFEAAIRKATKEVGS
ncbi:MAG: hypothetical protein ACFFB3_15185 [Candidatus Hodarchaeota archaeon]